MDDCPYQLPDVETLARYMALLRAVLLETRLAGYEGDAKLAADLMDAVENVPDLLLRWQEMDEGIVWAQLEGLSERAPRLVDRLAAIKDGDYRGLLHAPMRPG